jgi:hypothetical protein
MRDASETPVEDRSKLARCCTMWNCVFSRREARKDMLGGNLQENRGFCRARATIGA